MGHFSTYYFFLCLPADLVKLAHLAVHWLADALVVQYWSELSVRCTLSARMRALTLHWFIRIFSSMWQCASAIPAYTHSMFKSDPVL